MIISRRMIVAIYLNEIYGMLPVDNAIRVSKVERVARTKREREHERRRPVFSEVLTHTIAKRSDNYNSKGQFVEQDQLFNKLA